jgi:hypothetical protein
MVISQIFWIVGLRVNGHSRKANLNPVTENKI